VCILCRFYDTFGTQRILEYPKSVRNAVNHPVNAFVNRAARDENRLYYRRHILFLDKVHPHYFPVNGVKRVNIPLDGVNDFI